jgi:hypothetical protein
MSETTYRMETATVTTWVGGMHGRRGYALCDVPGVRECVVLRPRRAIAQGTQFPVRVWPGAEGEQLRVEFQAGSDGTPRAARQEADSR